MANTANFYTTDYDAQAAALQRQQALADALRKQSAQEISPGQMVGNWYVPTSPLHYLARALRGGQAASIEQQVAEAQKQLAAQRSAAVQQWAGQMPQPTTTQQAQPTNQEGTGSFDMSGSAGPQVNTQTQQPSMGSTMNWLAQGSQLGGNAAALGQTMIGLQQKHAEAQAGREARMEELTLKLADANVQGADRRRLQEQLAKMNDETKRYVADSRNETMQAIKAMGAGNQPVTSLVVRDPNSKTGWSYKDGRTGRLISTDAPPPSGSMERESNKMESKRQFNMSGIGSVIQSAEEILTGKGGNPLPTQSGIGSAYDTAAGWIGKTPEGAKEAERMRAIGGALVSKMPRMEGPQSDKDVALYKEMAGRVGDSTVPVERRKAALEEIKRLWSKYEKQNPDAFQGSAAGGGGAPRVVDW